MDITFSIGPNIITPSDGAIDFLKEIPAQPTTRVIVEFLDAAIAQTIEDCLNCVSQEKHGDARGKQAYAEALKDVREFLSDGIRASFREALKTEAKAE